VYLVTVWVVSPAVVVTVLVVPGAVLVMVLVAPGAVVVTVLVTSTSLPQAERKKAEPTAVPPTTIPASLRNSLLEIVLGVFLFFFRH